MPRVVVGIGIKYKASGIGYRAVQSSALPKCLIILLRFINGAVQRKVEGGEVMSIEPVWY